MRNSQKKKENNSIIVKFITAILILLCIIYVIIIVKNQNYRLIPGVIGIGAIIVTMNIANFIKIKKENAKTFSILSTVLSIITIPLLIFTQVVFSYILAVPAFILSKKALKNENSQTISKVAYIISLIILIVCIILSLMGGFSYVTGPTVLS